MEDHDGIVLGAHADSLLVMFRNPRAALECAIAMQDECQRVSQSLRPENNILLCIGLGYGDVLRAGQSELWGGEVNAASKLGEDTARPGEILVTGAFKAAVDDAPSTRFVDLGHAPPGASSSCRLDLD